MTFPVQGHPKVPTNGLANSSNFAARDRLETLLQNPLLFVSATFRTYEDEPKLSYLTQVGSQKRKRQDEGSVAHENPTKVWTLSSIASFPAKLVLFLTELTSIGSMAKKKYQKHII